MAVHRLSRGDVAALAVALFTLVLACAGSASASVVPNDPGFSLQWGDENTGQAIFELGPGTPLADDSADYAWSVTTGSPAIVIAETDTGVDYEHPDLQANIWSNPDALLAGCQIGAHGYDLLVPEGLPEHCEPRDADLSYGGHGTHVAGIMGAVGNNGLGVAGMNWHTTILPVKWLDSASEEPKDSSMKLAEALELIAKLSSAGVNVRVVNDSPTFEGTAKSAELEHAIKALGERGILFVTAANNTGVNENEKPSYPCAFDLANEICVTATDNRDELPTWANYGSSRVQLAAPGASIYSTLDNGGYGYVSGTSMAAAQVSGAAALILSREPWLTVAELKSDILAHVDKLPSLQGKVSSGGRLDVCAAMPGCVRVSPGLTPPPGASPASPPPRPQAVIASLKISPSSFKAARSGPIIFPKLLHAGAMVSYTDSRAAMTEFTVLAPHSGVLSRIKGCVAPPRDPHGKPHKPCVRWLSVGRFRRPDAAGKNSFRFSAHIGRASLAVGHYRLLAVPTFDGRAGIEALSDFRIVR